jgi:hypothetical protein
MTTVFPTPPRLRGFFSFLPSRPHRWPSWPNPGAGALAPPVPGVPPRPACRSSRPTPAAPRPQVMALSIRSRPAPRTTWLGPSSSVPRWGWPACRWKATSAARGGPARRPSRPKRQGDPVPSRTSEGSSTRRGVFVPRAVVGMRVKDSYSDPCAVVAFLACAPPARRGPHQTVPHPGRGPCQAGGVVRSWGGPVPDPVPLATSPGGATTCAGWPAPARGAALRPRPRPPGFSPAGRRAQAPPDPAAVVAPGGGGGKTRRRWRAAAAFGDPWERG